MLKEDYEGHWRASAFEEVPYKNDYPECLLVLPELIDGAIGQGRASKIHINIQIKDMNGSLTVTDNGIGIKSNNRLLNWTSNENVDTHHRYGHGSKKCLTKWNRDYNAKWYVKYRYRCPKNIIGCLNTFIGPFIGRRTMHIEDENDLDQETLYPSGLEWYIEFNKEIFGNLEKDEHIFNAIKELIRTRYSRKHLDIIEFTLQINNIIETSTNWKTFQECVEEEIVNNNCVLLHTVKEGIMTYNLYYLWINGSCKFNLKNEFPKYGQKNMNCSRLHISLDGRIIEIAPIYKFFDHTNNHNDFNGIIGFVNFEGSDYTKMPTPCTTKVSFYESCVNYTNCKNKIIQINLENKIKNKLDSIPDKSKESKTIEIPLVNLKPCDKPEKKKLKEQKTKQKVELEQKTDEMTSYIYLLLMIDSNTKENVYKVGRTKNLMSRIKDYGPTSKILLCIYVGNEEQSIKIETNIKKQFSKNEYITKKSGPEKEYFICNDQLYIMKYTLELLNKYSLF